MTELVQLKVRYAGEWFSSTKIIVKFLTNIVFGCDGRVDVGEEIEHEVFYFWVGRFANSRSVPAKVETHVRLRLVPVIRSARCNIFILATYGNAFRSDYPTTHPPDQ